MTICSLLYCVTVVVAELYVTVYTWYRPQCEYLAKSSREFRCIDTM